MAVGSQPPASTAADRGECDLAGVHLLAPETDHTMSLSSPRGVRLREGYGRIQGLSFVRATSVRDRNRCRCRPSALEDPDCLIVNRNRGQRHAGVD